MAKAKRTIHLKLTQREAESLFNGLVASESALLQLGLSELYLALAEALGATRAVPPASPASPAPPAPAPEPAQEPAKEEESEV